MEISASVAGHEGRLRVGYQTAAVLGAWRLSLLPMLPRRYELVAELAGTDAYWYARRPMSVQVDVGRDKWEWANVEPSESSDGKVRVELRGMPVVVRLGRTREA